MVGHPLSGERVATAAAKWLAPRQHDTGLTQLSAHQCGEVSLQKFQPCILLMLTARTTPLPLAEPSTMVTGSPTGSLLGFEPPVTLPVAVPLATEVRLNSAMPVMPQPASGAFGQVDMSAYVQRPAPSEWMSRLPE